jgi:mannose-6-phosphate isomerase-like protein (cupin superfamily)
VTPKIIVRSEWTGGGVCVIEDIMPAKSLAPMHKHECEGQTLFVLSGTVGVYVEGDDEIEIGTGEHAYRPPGLLHACWNPSTEPARVLEITTPGERFQSWLLELSAMTAQGRAERSAIAARARHAGITFEAGRTEELCDRFGVSPSQVFWQD